jgi:four helix bundle protein
MEAKMEEGERKQSPIFTRTSDFVLWLLNHTEKFPKSERFRMAKRLEDSAFSFYELLIEATRSTKRKRQLLIQADVELEKLRLFIRMSQQCKLTSISQYHFAAGVMVEIGKLLGGWLKTVPEI